MNIQIGQHPHESPESVIRRAHRMADKLTTETGVPHRVIQKGSAAFGHVFCIVKPRSEANK